LLLLPLDQYYFELQSRLCPKCLAINKGKILQGKELVTKSLISYKSLNSSNLILLLLISHLINYFKDGLYFVTISAKNIKKKYNFTFFLLNSLKERMMLGHFGTKACRLEISFSLK
jgi:hypothetical protein